MVVLQAGSEHLRGGFVGIASIREVSGFLSNAICNSSISLKKAQLQAERTFSSDLEG